MTWSAGTLTFGLNRAATIIVSALVDAQCLLHVQPRGFLADPQDDGLVNAHVRFQFLPQFFNSEQAVGIQLIKPLLPRHEYLLELVKVKRQLFTVSRTVVMIC